MGLGVGLGLGPLGVGVGRGVGVGVGLMAGEGDGLGVRLGLMPGEGDGLGPRHTASHVPHGVSHAVPFLHLAIEHGLTKQYTNGLPLGHVLAGLGVGVGLMTGEGDGDALVGAWHFGLQVPQGTTHSGAVGVHLTQVQALAGQVTRGFPSGHVLLSAAGLGSGRGVGVGTGLGVREGLVGFGWQTASHVPHGTVHSGVDELHLTNAQGLAKHMTTGLPSAQTWPELGLPSLRGKTTGLSGSGSAADAQRSSVAATNANIACLAMVRLWSLQLGKASAINVWDTLHM